MHAGKTWGTVGGTLTTVLFTSTGDVVKTVVLAVIGATVSYLVSYGLKWLSSKIRSLRDRGEK